MRRFLWILFCLPALAFGAEPEAPFSKLFPILFYTPDTGFGVGGFLIRNLDQPAQGEPSQLVAFVNVTQKGQIIALAEPKFYWDDGRWEWSGKVFVQNFPSTYYGRGTQELDPKDGELFSEKRLAVDTKVRQIFYERFFWDLELGGIWQKFAAQHEEGATPNIDAELERWGRDNTQQFFGLGLGHDNRNGRTRPTAGHVVRAFVRSYNFKTEKVQEDFYARGIDAKQYFTLADRQSLALQVYAAATEQEDLPFYLLQVMGGSQVLRGFYSNQFRDYAVAFSQAEWRYVWNQDWGLRTFAGVGTHAKRLNELRETSGKAAGGFGVDYFLDPKSMINLRLDFGFSKDNFGVYFLFGNAF